MFKERLAIRRGAWTKPTCGLAPSYIQANLVIVPYMNAYDFLLFCMRNPKSCPVIEVTDQGSYTPEVFAPDADLRTDVPKYHIYRYGEWTDEKIDIKEEWRNDFVSFLIGCSLTFENALMSQGIPMRHIENEQNVSMYQTNIPCKGAGKFHGNLVVSMRPIRVDRVADAIRITANYPSMHGSPIQVGYPERLGIKNIKSPDYGDPVEIKEDEIPVFWACGVTPQFVAQQSKIEMMITHAPGHMFITNRLDSEIEDY
ncbi:MAG TPA: putative hydro-lyase [Virgibacillus sp.]|nr:putative hydro-lyase [Virgibacillus sp.]HLR68365.1 putative hydro-lyase [Virgibacillus sp.]